MTCEIVPNMTYNVFGGTLNLAQSILESTGIYLWFNLTNMSFMYRTPGVK